MLTQYQTLTTQQCPISVGGFDFIPTIFDNFEAIILEMTFLMICEGLANPIH